MSNTDLACAQAQDFLYRFLDNEIYCFHEGENQDFDLRRTIEFHLEHCPGCADLVAIEAARSAKLRELISQSCRAQAPAELISSITISIQQMASALTDFYQPIQTTHILIHLEPHQFFANGHFFVQIESYQTLHPQFFMPPEEE